MTRLQKALDAACESPPATIADGRLVLERLATESRVLATALATPSDREARGWASALADQCRDVVRRSRVAGPVDVAARPRRRRRRTSPGSRRIPTLRELAALDGEWAGPARARIAAIDRLAAQAIDLAEMEWSFLFDRTRHLLSIGYNVAERRRDSSYYDLLASEARLCTFVAIAQGHLPQESWFALGRLLTTAAGEPVLLSWSGSMFEYLMPLVVMPGYDDTLLDQTCKAAVKRQIEYGRHRGVPWGISESGYNLLDGAAHLPVPRVRRARPRPQARPRRRSRRRALRVGPRADGVARGGVREPAAARGRGLRRESSASTRRSTTRRRACRAVIRTPSFAPTWRITRA